VRGKLVKRREDMRHYQMAMNNGQAIQEGLSWDPYIVERKTAGTVHWLNRSQPDEQFIQDEIWKNTPNDEYHHEFYFCYGNKYTMFYVIEGEAKFCPPDNQTMLMRKGDVYFLPRESEGMCRILTPFAKFFIQTNSLQKDGYLDSLLSRS
jgi:uncharacterized cupin superfamily protein